MGHLVQVSDTRANLGLLKWLMLACQVKRGVHLPELPQSCSYPFNNEQMMEHAHSIQPSCMLEQLCSCLRICMSTKQSLAGKKRPADHK